MIDRQHGEIVFECDSCDTTFTAGSNDFTEAWALAKRDGWKSRKIGQDWIHSCEHCARRA